MELSDVTDEKQLTQSFKSCRNFFSNEAKSSNCEIGNELFDELVGLTRKK